MHMLVLLLWMQKLAELTEVQLVAVLAAQGWVATAHAELEEP